MAKKEGYFNPWLTLVGGMFYMYCAGFIHSFPILSPHFKDVLGYSQNQTQQINGLIKLGGLFAVVGGMVFDSPRGGPRATAAGAIILYTIGVWALYLGAVDSLPTDVEYWHICVAAFVFAAGAVWGDTTAVCTNVINFPDNRGSVVAFLKSSTGIAAAICSQFYLGLFQPDVVDFMRFVCFVYVAVFMLLFPVFKVIDPTTRAEFERRDTQRSKHFRNGFIVVGSLAFFLLAAGIFQKTIPTVTHSPPPGPEVRLGLTIAMVCILMSLWTLPIGTGPIWMRSLEEPEPLLNAANQDESLLKSDDVEKGKDDSAPSKPKPATKEGKTFGQAIVSPEFLLLIVVSISIEGGAMILYSNMPQILQAMGEDKDYAAVFVSVFSVSTCIGRLTVPTLTDSYPTKFPRTYSPMLGVVLIMLANAALTVANSSLLYPITAVIGYAHGGYTGSLPAVVVEVFGKRAYGTIYGCFRLCPTLGVSLFAGVLFGSIYETHTPDGSNVCESGIECFRTAAVIMTGCCVVSALACVLFIRQTSHITAKNAKVAPSSMASSIARSASNPTLMKMMTRKGTYDKDLSKEADKANLLTTNSTPSA